jgi:hypothetical protein
MNRARRRLHVVVVVAAATLISFAVPAVAPLYADVYPSGNAETFAQALSKANLVAGFAGDEVTQFEPAVFSATITYARAIDPGLPVIKVGESNEATLSSTDAAAFTIVPTSSSRQDLDTDGTPAHGGGYQLTWTWKVTPLKSGLQNLTLSIIPTVVVNGQVQPSTAESRNEPYSVTIRVNPAKQAFDDVVTTASSLHTHVPDQMVVGQEYDVSASLSLAGHGGGVHADIQLSAAPGSAGLTIRGATASGDSGVAQRVSAAAPQTVTRHWTVVADKTGPIALVFTVTVDGRAGVQSLHKDVLQRASSRSVSPPPTVWDIVRAPIDYLGPFVSLTGGVIAIGATITGAAWWKKRSGRGKQTTSIGDGGGGTS